MLGSAESWQYTLADYNVFSVTYCAGYSTPFTVANATDIVTLSGRVPVDGERFKLWNTGGALPAGFTASPNYYVIGTAGYACQFSLASGGGAELVTTDGTGTHFAGTIPDAFRQAILMLVTDMYENRNYQNESAFMLRENLTVTRLLWPYRVLENC